ncbi:hypothetical protein COM84_21125 [Bacillus thuringiensis]|nr:hypothetical protein COM84_21125 [Bacillus thuringiensis]
MEEIVQLGFTEYNDIDCEVMDEISFTEDLHSMSDLVGNIEFHSRDELWLVFFIRYRTKQITVY